MTDDDDELLDEKATCAFLGGIHKATLRRGIADGRFPPPVKLGPQIRRWRKPKLRAAVERLEKA